MKDIMIAAYSDIGGRKENEDSYGYAQDRRGAFWASIADGLGSYGGGKIASEIAVEECRTFFSCKSFCSTRELGQLFDAVNSGILQRQSDDVKMRTTAVFLAAKGSRLIWGHVGDSRMYHYLNGELVRYTVDHSVSQLAVALGEISRDQIPGHSARNKLTKALGTEGTKPEIHPPVKLERGSHAFLLCTDGFWEYVTEDEMQSELLESRTPDEWLERMRTKLRLRCGDRNDNNTAVTVFAKKRGIF